MKRSERKKLYRGRRQPSIYSRTEENIVKRDYKKGFLIILLVILVVGLLYFLFFSPYFRINEIKINDLEYSDKSLYEVKAKEFTEGSIINRNILFSQYKKLEKIILEESNARSVKVKKIFPHTVFIEIEELAPVLTWQVIDKKYLVDKDGVIRGDYEDKFSKIPTVTDLKGVPVENGKRVVPGEFALFVDSVWKDFYYYTNAKITKIEVTDTTEDIKVTSDSTWYAYFDTARTAKNEMISLARIINEAKSKNKKLEYIDLRIDNRIFYK